VGKENWILTSSHGRETVEAICKMHCWKSSEQEMFPLVQRSQSDLCTSNEQNYSASFFVLKCEVYPAHVVTTYRGSAIIILCEQRRWPLGQCDGHPLRDKRVNVPSFQVGWRSTCCQPHSVAFTEGHLK